MTGHDSKDRTVGTGELGTRAMEKNSWDWQGVDGTGQADRTSGTGQLEEAVEIIQPRMETEDRMART